MNVGLSDVAEDRLPRRRVPEQALDLPYGNTSGGEENRDAVAATVLAD